MQSEKPSLSRNVTKQYIPYILYKVGDIFLSVIIIDIRNFNRLINLINETYNITLFI